MNKNDQSQLADAAAAVGDENPPPSEHRRVKGNESKSLYLHKARANTTQRDVGLVTIDDEEAPTPTHCIGDETPKRVIGKVELIPDSEPSVSMHGEESLKMKSTGHATVPIAPPLFREELSAFEHHGLIESTKANERNRKAANRFCRNTENENVLQVNIRPNAGNQDTRAPNPILQTDDVEVPSTSITAEVQRMSTYFKSNDFNSTDEIFIPEATAVEDEDIPSAEVVRPEKNFLTIAGRKIQLRYLVLGMSIFLVLVIALSITLTKNDGVDTNSITRDVPANDPSDSPSASLYPSMDPSTYPSTSPTSILYAELMDVISNHTGGNLSSSFSDTQSMHRIALNWLVEDQTKWRQEERELLSDVEIVERFVLALLYFETDGNGWTYPFNFLSQDHVCRWRDYQDRTFKKGVIRCTHGSTGRIQNLTLSNNKLRGSIPTEIGWLDDLTALHIEQNGIRGTIPDELESLTKITHLELSSNQLGGSVGSLASLTSLKYIDLKYNAFTGSIHSLEGLENLHYVDLSNNDMTGSLMNASNLSKLESFKAYGNMLSGSVPNSFSGLSTLETLHLNGNQLTGNVNFLCEDLPSDLKLDCFGDKPEVACNCCSGCTIVNDTECTETEKLITLSIDSGIENGFEWEIQDSSYSVLARDGPYGDEEHLNIQLCLTFPGWYHISTKNVEGITPSETGRLSFAIDGYNSSIMANALDSFYVAANPTLSPTGSPTGSSLPTTTTSSPTFSSTAYSTQISYDTGELVVLPPPPMPAPIICDGIFELELTTDAFGLDTSWELVERDSGDILVSKSSFASNTTLLFSECLFLFRCYDFVIKDEWDDGICCQQGLGFYNVSVNGVVFGSGGQFGSYETVPLGGNCVGNSTEGWASMPL